MCSGVGCRPRGRRVTPFGHPRIKGHVLLPAAFRSLSRPSSPCGSIGIRHRPNFRLTILSVPRAPAAEIPRRQAMPEDPSYGTRVRADSIGVRIPDDPTRAICSALCVFQRPWRDEKTSRSVLWRIGGLNP